MTVTQVGRTRNSVTINVKGITQGHRQTYVAIPQDIIPPTRLAELKKYFPDNIYATSLCKYFWYDLSTATKEGYIISIETNYDINNGDIKIEFNEEYIWPYKGWYILVQNVTGTISSGDIIQVIQSVQTVAFLQFQYENSCNGDNFEKSSGEPIDITVADMLNIDMFAFQIGYLPSQDEESVITNFNEIEAKGSGDEIRAYYLRWAADNIIYSTDLIENYSNGTILDYDQIYEKICDIYNGCWPDNPFKAEFFTDIQKAINNFNIQIQEKLNQDS